MTLFVYTREDCTACYYTKRWLKAHHVDFTEINLTEDDSKVLADKGFKTLPVVVCQDGASWAGFDIDKLRTYAKPGAPTGQSAQQPEGE